MEENKIKYGPQKKYHKNNLKQIKFCLNKNTDAELIEFVETLPNKADFFKNCIRECMQKKFKKI